MRLIPVPFVFVALVVCVHARATTLQYDRPVGIVGTLTERRGVDCCTYGKQSEVSYPAVELDRPIDVELAAGAPPDETAVTEVGVTLIHLVIAKKEHWAAFRARIGKRARVQCSLFHAHTGHHQTPVLCEVRGISGAQGFREP